VETYRLQDFVSRFIIPPIQLSTPLHQPTPQVEICSGKAALSKGLRMSGFQGKEFDVPWKHAGIWLLVTIFNV